MKNKAAKFILKSVFIFPVGFGFWVLIYGFNINNWIPPIIAGLIISFGIIFLNLFDYEKYNDINTVDFLESKHKITTENTNKNWEQINKIIQSQLIKLKVLEKSETVIKLQIERRFLDSILIIKRTQKEISLKIERKYFNFLPDNAENYRTLKKIEKEIKTTTNKTITSNYN